MIFVTVGSRNYPFDRLFIELDKLYDEGVIKDTMFAQIGTSTYKPKNFEYKDFISQEEFLEKVKQASFVISHGASGSIMKALNADKKVIAVTRLEKYGEHINDHQVQNNEAFGENGYVLPVFEMNELKDAIVKIQEGKDNLKKWENKDPMAIVNMIDDFIKENWDTVGRDKFNKILSKFFIKDENKIFWKKFFYCKENNNIKALKYKYDIYKIKQKYNCYIPINAQIGKDISLPHGLNGIFISHGAIIGNNCVIFHQVTIGSNTLKDSKKYGAPKIGDNCYIGCGAKIIGNVKIGNNVRIGANCVVVNDIPDNCTVVSSSNKIIEHTEPRNNRYYGYNEKNK